MADIFACPKCGEGLTGPVDAKNDTVCPNCRRRWRLLPDRSAIMGARSVLIVQGAQHAHKEKKHG